MREKFELHLWWWTQILQDVEPNELLYFHRTEWFEVYSASNQSESLENSVSPCSSTNSLFVIPLLQISIKHSYVFECIQFIPVVMIVRTHSFASNSVFRFFYTEDHILSLTYKEILHQNRTTLGSDFHRPISWNQNICTVIQKIQLKIKKQVMS